MLPEEEVDIQLPTDLHLHLVECQMTLPSYLQHQNIRHYLDGKFGIHT